MSLWPALANASQSKDTRAFFMGWALDLLPQSNELSLGGCKRWLRHMLNMMDLYSTCNSTANSSLDLCVQVPSLRDFKYDPRCLL